MHTERGLGGTSSPEANINIRGTGLRPALIGHDAIASGVEVLQITWALPGEIKSPRPANRAIADGPRYNFEQSTTGGRLVIANEVWFYRHPQFGPWPRQC